MTPPSSTKQLLSAILIFCTILSSAPFSQLFPTVARANETDSEPDPCLVAAEMRIGKNDNSPLYTPIDYEAENGFYDEETALQIVDGLIDAPETPLDSLVDVTAVAIVPKPEDYPLAPELGLAMVTSQAYLNRLVGFLGEGTILYTVPTGGGELYAVEPGRQVIVTCSNAEKYLDESLLNPYTPTLDLAIATEDLTSPLTRLGFKNPIDRYFLLGEPCAGGLIDTPQSQWNESTNPCPGFRSEDDFIANGVWDAPKVDVKVLRTLEYLVTPIEEGGAGREYIRVKQLVLNNNTGNPFDSPILEDTAEDTSSIDQYDAINQEIAQLTGEAGNSTNEALDATTSLATEDTDTEPLLPSAYLIDPSDPPHLPGTISRAVMIDQVDRLRVTTKVTQKRLFGNNSVSYTTQAPIPINLSWQSDEGMAQDAPPDVSNYTMLKGSRVLVNASIVQLLNSMGLGDLEIDTTEAEINTLGDVAELVGLSLVEQLLGTPRGSMKGYSLLSTLESIGLSYLEQNLGLVPGSLADPNPLDGRDQGLTSDYTQVVETIGRRTTEYVLGLPADSLKTKTGTSSEVLEAMGRSYLETEIFQVTTGTLTPSEGYPLSSIGDLLARLGEGRIEKVFKLPAQSLRKKTYAAELGTDSFRESSFKASLLFPKNTDVSTLKEEDFLMADWVSGQLSLEYTPYVQVDESGKRTAFSTNMYGFTADDFSFPTLSISPLDSDSLERFKQIVGSRVVETSLGVFKREGDSDLSLTGEVSPDTPPATFGSEWTATINGEPLNPQFVPYIAGDATLCTDSRTTYASAWTGGGGTDAREFTGDLTKEKVTEIIEFLKERTSTLNGNYIGPTVTCTPDPTVAESRTFTGLTRQVLFESTPLYRYVFLNADKAPKPDDFNTEDDPKGQGGEARDKRLNTALLLYYNLPENHQKVSINEIPLSNEAMTAQVGGDTPASDITSMTVNRVLTTLSNGGSLTESGYRWGANSELSKRLAMLKDLQEQDTKANTFDIGGILTDDMADAARDAALVDRINRITVRPAIGTSFEAQYNDPKYNGWLYLIQDIREHVSCAAKGGRYVFNADKTGMQCAQLVYLGQQPENVQGLNIDDKLALTEAVKLIDRLYTEPWTVAQSLLKALSSLTSSDITSASNGSSAMAQATGLTVPGRTYDANRRISSLPNCEGVGSGCYTGRDLLRALVAPTKNGVVSLTTSVDSYFTQGTQQRSALQMVGRQYAARTFSNDTIAQTSFAANLKADFSDALESTAKLSDSIEALDAVIKNRSEDAELLGVDISKIEDQGMLTGDFARIFSLDQSKQVFSRIGKDQLLKVVWERSGATDKIKSRAEYQQYMKLVNQTSRTAMNAADTITFYRTRLELLRTQIDELSKELNGVAGDLRKALTTLRSNDITNALRGERERTEIVSRYSAVVSAIQAKYLEKDGMTNQLATRIATIEHLIQELQTGRKLPVNHVANPFAESSTSYNTGLTKNADRTSSGSCVAKSLVINLFNPGSIKDRVTTYAKEVGSCQVERQLGLPSGSLLAWYDLGSQDFFPKAPNTTTALDAAYQQVLESLSYTINPDTGLPTEETPEAAVDAYNTYLNLLDETNAAQSEYKAKLASFYSIEAGGGSIPVRAVAKTGQWKKNQWNITNLYIALGVTQLRQRNDQSIRDVPNSELSQWLFSQGPERVLALQTSGKILAQTTIMNRLASMLGGILGSSVAQYRLTTEDFVAILQGSMRPLFEKVGGTILDQAMGLETGTAAALMYPVCTDSNGDEVACNNDPANPDSNVANVRARILATAGLRKLGLQVGTDLIPAGFDFFGGDNLAEAWGNATISRDLNLATSSFRGLITTSSSQAGTKACKQQALRCLNDASTLSRAFGFSQHPLRIAIDLINRRALTALSSSPLSREGIIGTDYEAIEQLKAARLRVTIDSETALDDVTLRSASDPTSAYWKLGTPEEDSALATTTKKDWERFLSYTGSVWTTLQSSPISDSAKQAARTVIIQALVAPLGESGSSLVSSLRDITNWQDVVTVVSFASFGSTVITATYRNSIIPVFKSRLVSLNKRYTKEGSASGRFESFIRGEITAETVATEATELTLVDGTIANLINQRIADGPIWLKNINTTLQLVSAEQCDRAYSVGDLITNAVRQNLDCLSPMGKFSTKDLIYGTSENMQNLRGMLFDNYLSAFFSAELEQGIGVRTGTFRRIALSPSSARQIVAQEGVLLVADSILGKSTKYDPCAYQTIPGGDCVQHQLTSAVREAFLAGFCSEWKQIKRKDTTAGCDFTFSSSRSRTAFSDKAYEALDKQLARIGNQYLGVSMSRASLAGIEHGDMRPLAVVAAQAIVNQLNQQLFNGSLRSPLGRFNAIFANDMRAAVGLDEAAPYQEAYSQAYADELSQQFITEMASQDRWYGASKIGDSNYSTVYTTDLNDTRLTFTLSIPNSAIIKTENDYGLLDSNSLSAEYKQYTIQSRETIAGRTLTSDEHQELDSIADAKRQERAQASTSDAMRARRVAARNRVQYAFYDALLASKLQYLPPRFSERLLSNNSQARGRALAEFAFGSVMNSKTPYGAFLRSACGKQTEVDCFALFDGLAASIKKGGQSMEDFYTTNSKFITLLDTQLSGWFSETAGFALPTGTLTGIYVWGMKGFKSADFNKEGFCLGTETADGGCGGTFAVPVGRILQTYGEQKLFAWGDSLLGTKPGTTAKLVRIASMAIDLQKDLASLKNYMAGEYNAVFEAVQNGELDNFTALGELGSLAEYDIQARARITDKRATGIGQLASEVVVSIFSAQFSEFDTSAGLPSGTTALVVGAAVTYGASMAFGASGSAATAAAFGPAFFVALGFTLILGVTKVEVVVRATADGYYPFFSDYYGLGTGEAAGCGSSSGILGGCKSNGAYYEHLTPDPSTGTFDASRTTSYRKGLQTAARAKVRSLLINLLTMPGSEWATQNDFEYLDSWPTQVFTYGGEGAEYNVMENRIIASYVNRNTPFHPTNPDYGYGSLDERCVSVSAGPNPFSISCQRRQEWRIGYFGMPKLLDAIHIRF